MKIKVRNILIDTDIEPAMLIFKNDDDRKQHADNIKNNFVEKEGERKYIIYPDNFSNEEIVKFKESPINDDDILFKEKYIRLYADFENYRKRVTKEKQDIKNDTISQTLSSILDLDNDLNHALKQIKNQDDKKGLELIISKMDRFMSSNNIEVIQTSEYDSDMHEVISVVETGEEGILDVASKGYKINGKVVRHPKVVLSK